MRSGGASESKLAYAVDLMVQLRRDAGTAEPELHRRDRALLPVSAREGTPQELLMRWLGKLREAGYRLPGFTVASVFRGQLLALSVGGLAIGWLVTSALFSYDGSKPVNVVHVLAGLVGVQLVLLALLGLVWLPGWVTRWVPGLQVLQDLLSLLSPGQITRALARRLPAPWKQVEIEAGGGPWAGRILKWAAMVSAQSFGVAFNLGALGAALYLVTFSDLEFSWSTTLSPDAERGYRLTRWLSAPWQAWWPEAVPTKGLIESTLYYRREGLPREMDPQGWGGWWPFLVASVVVYGLVPRLTLLGVGLWRLGATLRDAMIGSPGVDEVIARLKTEAVSTRAVQPEPESPSSEAKRGVLGGASVGAGRYWVVNWGGIRLEPDQMKAHLAVQHRAVVEGIEAPRGAAELELDAQVVERIADESSEAGVLILVKAWEPPVLEFLDFLSMVRERAGRGRRMVVMLVGFNGDGTFGPPREGDVRQWQRKVETLGDESLTVAPWEGRV